MIRKILNHTELQQKPLVLIDIGASGSIHKKWKKIANYSYCIAFDPDDRKFNVSEAEKSIFRKMFVVPRIVSNKADDEIDFFLTDSPYCSSTLRPLTDELKSWTFYRKFIIKKQTKLPATTLAKALESVQLDYIDWLKTDTQGTDLRLYNSLPESVKSKLSIVELEPGYIDAYEGEDGMLDALSYMKKEDKFWLCSMTVKGTQRLSSELFQSMNLTDQKFLQLHHKTSPCWAELCYLRKISTHESFDQRHLLVLYLCAILERQYGFALEVALTGAKYSGDNIWKECQSFAQSKLKMKWWKLPKTVIHYFRLKAQS